MSKPAWSSTIFLVGHAVLDQPGPHRVRLVVVPVHVVAGDQQHPDLAGEVAAGGRPRAGRPGTATAVPPVDLGAQHQADRRRGHVRSV